MKKADTRQKPTYDELVKAFADVVDQVTRQKKLSYERCEEIIVIRENLF